MALRRMNDKRESATLPGDISPARHALGKLLGALLVAASALIGLSAPAFGASGSLKSSGSHQMLPRLTSPRLASPGLPPLPQQSLPGVQGYLSGVSCASVLSCVAVGWSYNKGYTPLILSTSDAGATWITPLAVARMPPVSMPQCEQTDRRPAPRQARALRPWPFYPDPCRPLTAFQFRSRQLPRGTLMVHCAGALPRPYGRSTVAHFGWTVRDLIVGPDGFAGRDDPAETQPGAAGGSGGSAGHLPRCHAGIHLQGLPGCSGMLECSGVLRGAPGGRAKAASAPARRKATTDGSSGSTTQ